MATEQIYKFLLKAALKPTNEEHLSGFNNLLFLNWA